MSNGNSSGPKANERRSKLTRRSLLALAGATGLGLVTSGTATAASDYLQIDGGNAMTADLDVGGNSVTNAVSIDFENIDTSEEDDPETDSDPDNSLVNVNGIDLQGHIDAGQDWTSWNTSGSGNGHVQLRDAQAGAFHLRTTEGTDGVPGEIVVQAPMRSANTDDAGVDEASPTSAFEIGADNLSVSEWRMIDVVQEPSIDHTGDLGEQIHQYLNTATNNGEPVNHRFIIPDGTYTWNTPLDESQFASDAEFTYLGVVGRGDVTLDVTDPKIHEESGNEGILFDINYGSCQELELADFVVDVTDDGSTTIDAGIVIASVQRHANVRDLTLEGQRDRLTDSGERGNRYTCRVNTTTQRGFSVIRNVRLTDGDAYYPDRDQASHAIPFSSSKGHVGRNLWVGCHVEGFIDNGFYVKAQPVNGKTGANYVYHCRVKNCGNGGIRLGDGDHAECCEIVNDDADDRGYTYTALWFDTGHCTASDISIDVDAVANSGAVRVRSQSTYADNVTIESDAEHFILDAGSSGSGQAVLTNWRVVDESSDSDQSHPFCAIVRRNNVVIDGWDVDIKTDTATGKRYGFRIGDVDDRSDDNNVTKPENTVIRNCRISHNRDEHDRVLIQIDGTNRTQLLFNEFGGRWIYPASATAEDCLVIGNRVGVDEVAGDQSTWQGDFNFGYEL